ncbi:MAG: hypothetical protein ACI4N8_07800 [Megasphaera sp.]|uniref:hypothetical protein n=1 Tax=Megasphaera sp. TaxID=2023260 RepID=UPI003F00DF27
MERYSEKVTTKMIEDALMQRYQEPEWYLGFEVGNSCGSELTRHADAIAVCPYPSRSFETIGFEIKVSRQDLLRELEHPQKCEAMYEYTNEWFLIIPKGMTKGLSIPERWGIMEYMDGKLRQKRKAAWHEAKLTTGFMIAFIRGRQRIEAIQQQKMYENSLQCIRNQMSWEAKEDHRKLAELKDELKVLERETGISLTGYNTDSVLKVLKLAQQLTDTLKLDKGFSVEKDIEYAAGLLQESADKIKKAYEMFLPLLGTTKDCVQSETLSMDGKRKD